MRGKLLADIVKIDEKLKTPPIRYSPLRDASHATRDTRGLVVRLYTVYIHMVSIPF